MSSFNIVKEIEPKKTFRVEAIKSIFDLDVKTVKENFRGNLDLENKPWNIGVIFGASGTGKSTIGKKLYPKEYVHKYQYSAQSIVDDMPQKCDVEQISKTFNSVGFSSPPSWLKPYSVLSTGERMRVDLARSLLEDQELIVFDEFTSVVNREVAKIGSFALQKTVRKVDRKFIAISCHEDILEWLEPDWVFNTNNFQFFFLQDIDAPKLNSKFINAEEIIGDFLKNITI